MLPPAAAVATAVATPGHTTGAFDVIAIPIASRVRCEVCPHKSRCLAAGLEPQELAGFASLARAKRRVPRGSALFRSADPLEALYVIHSGTFKKTVVNRDARDKVTGFYYTGDVLGLDAIDRREHRGDAIALEDAQVCIIPYVALEQLALAAPRLQQQLFRLLSADIARDHGLMLLLGGMSAEERVAAFLLSVSEAYQRRGYAADDFRLRMTREEIGSFLGLTLETVSRTTSRLQRDGVLYAHGREMHLNDVARLSERMG
jgi:CRP/FNR family transcriptional regulator, anaerobic regulatory protein